MDSNHIVIRVKKPTNKLSERLIEETIEHLDEAVSVSNSLDEEQLESVIDSAFEYNFTVVSENKNLFSVLRGNLHPLNLPV